MPNRIPTRCQRTPNRPVTRRTPAERGYDALWRKLREAHVADHPLCEDCLEEGVTNPEFLEVDHVIPIDVRPDLRLDPANLRSRSRKHHKLKADQDLKTYGSGANASRSS